MLFNKVSFALTALLSSSVVLMSGCTTSPSSTASNTQQQTQNGLLVYGGPILTMQGMQPSYVDAMLIQDGKIRYTGTLSEAEKLAPQAKRLNLNNKTVIPGIIDAHSHLNSVGMQQTVANLYPPPDGKVVSIATLIQEMKAWAKQNPTFVQATAGWIIGNGYDDAQLQEKAHPTATDLDQISTTQPVLILHQSGHLASVNHKALELLGINEKSSNPSGGVIRRVVGTNIPNGVLEESVVIEAMLQAFRSHLK